MKLRILAVGSKLPDWVAEGYADYARRLPREFQLSLIEVPVISRKQQPVERARHQEGTRLLELLTGRDWVVALDVLGKALTTEELAEQLGSWQMRGRDVAFLIGGPDGLDPDCLARADQRVSLSALTFPHGLVRVMLVEQIYRAWTLRTGHPYHRA